jgi:hypothetical protein
MALLVPKPAAKVFQHFTGLFYGWRMVAVTSAGAVWDRWQTYEPILWSLVVMFFISGIFYSLVGRPWAHPKPL